MFEQKEAKEMSIGNSNKTKAIKGPLQFTQALIFLCIFACTAHGQRIPFSQQQVDVTGVYSYLHANAENSTGSYNLNGGGLSVSYDFTDRFAAVGEFGAYRFSTLPNQIGSNQYTYLFGPRVTLPTFRRLNPFAVALVGVGRLTASSGGNNAGENAFAMTAGGGFDVPFRSHFSIRALEIEYLMTRFLHTDRSPGTQNDVRISAGLTYSFGPGR